MFIRIDTVSIVKLAIISPTAQGMYVSLSRLTQILPVWHKPGKPGNRRQPGKTGLQLCIEPAL